MKELCPTCAEPYGFPQTMPSTLCSDAFHSCRGCAWEEGILVQACDLHQKNCQQCYTCLDTGVFDFNNPVMTRMVVCSKCGNKRCPHATFHGNACTGSNESGQPGSRY